MTLFAPVPVLITAMWSLRIALARFRPVGFSLLAKGATVGLVMAAFLYGDYRLFRRVFEAVMNIEQLSPFFAFGLIANFTGLVFLIAFFVLFFSSLTASIGAFFTDSDLEIYHAAPVSRGRILIARWGKSFVQSSYVVIAFLIPMFLAMQRQYGKPLSFFGHALLDLVLLLTISVSAAAIVVQLLVRFFPVRRVHQVAATLAILFLTTVVVGVRMARPERLFTQISTDDLVTVLKAIHLPASEHYPSGWLAAALVSRSQGMPATAHEVKLAVAAAIAFALFFLIARMTYFRAFVRSKETAAPTAIGSGGATRLVDALIRRFDPQVRAMIAKEARVVTRDAAQWSQLFMMVALLFLYLYNIQMMPLEGDIRAALLAYLNVGMAGFVISAIALRFAFPSVSYEGKQFWLLQTAPISYRRLLWVKVLVYGAPLLLLALFLVAAANAILGANPVIWTYTIFGSILMTVTLVALGVGMGGMAPDFATENPLQTALSLGGLAYMALSLLYVGSIMFLVARPVQRFLLRMLFGIVDRSATSAVLPLLLAIALSVLLSLLPIEVAQRRLSNLR